MKQQKEEETICVELGKISGELADMIPKAKHAKVKEAIEDARLIIRRAHVQALNVLLASRPGSIAPIKLPPMPPDRTEAESSKPESAPDRHDADAHQRKATRGLPLA